jgi:penicillin amidase
MAAPLILNEVFVFRNHPLSARFLLALVVSFLLLGAGLAYYAHASRGQASGTAVVCCLAAEVTITRDDRDVVYIQGRSDRDVFFAVGFAHAQDRMWQLELQRRMVQGRLSELFGKASLRQDLWFRTLALDRAAAAAWPSLSREAQASLQAYADGVNAAMGRAELLAPEFVLLGVKPAPWRPVDSLGVAKLFALNLSGNHGNEVARLVAGAALGPARAAGLFPPYPDAAPVTAAAPAATQAVAQALAGLRALQEETEVKLQIGGPYVGSNAWVVAGRLAEGGKPILANDPHLSLQMPSLWYPLDLRGDRLQATGMSLVGLPIVIFGKNRNIAWGGTNMMADVQDLYFEQPHGLDPDQYRDGAGWQRFVTRTEEIHVKADFPAALRSRPDPVRVQVRSTLRGPIISDVLGPGLFDQPVALRWTALDPGDSSYEALFRLNYADDWSGFKAALAYHVAPVLNMLYADNKGNIGYLGAGRVPVRSKGIGALPVPAWTGDYRWTGYVPAASMPQSWNPPQGYIVSANNRVAGPGYPYFISNDWAPPARAERIEQLLAHRVGSGQPVTLAYSGQMQQDLLSLEARQMLPLLTALQPANARQREALRYLAQWQGEMALDSQAASIYTAWMTQLRRQLFGAALSGYWNQPGKAAELDLIIDATSTQAVHDALVARRTEWCGSAGDCRPILGAALDAGLRQLEKMGGRDMAAWRWGELHAVHFRHMPFSDVKLLDRMFTRTRASGGSGATVNAANARQQGGERYVQNFGASFRQIVQPGEGAHWFVNSTGQSGNPLSPHYDDMIDAYSSGAYFRFDARRAASRLSLLPGAAGGRQP